MINAVEISSLSKVYAPDVWALDHIDLHIPRGSIYGLLGPNGAGKSTLINIMAGLIAKTEGSVKIWDVDMSVDPRNAKAAIGVVPQEINYDPFFTPEQLLDIQAGLYGVPKKERRTKELLALVGLEDHSTAYTRTLSGGMKRRLMVAKAMVHSPPILVLDEPTAGVDIELRQQMWENIRDLNRQGVTILLTTHYLQEAEDMCDRIAIINHGKIVVDERKDALLARLDVKDLHIRLDRPATDIPPSLQRLRFDHEDPCVLAIRYSPKDYQAGQIIDTVRNAGYGIADLSTRQGDLEDIFMQMTSDRKNGTS